METARAVISEKVKLAETSSFSTLSGESRLLQEVRTYNQTFAGRE